MKKKNYVPVDTSKVKFVEGSESEDIEIEEENDSDIDNEIYDDNLVSDSNDDSNDESINNINKKSKGKKKNKNLSNDEESQEDDDFDDENEEEDLSDDDEMENENGGNKEDNDFIKVSWKKDKKNYYQYESDNSSSDDDEEDNDERMKEVIYLNKKEKENLNENDFDLYNIYMNEKDGISSKNKDDEIDIDEKENAIKKLINNMANELKEKKKEINIDEKDKKDIEEMIMSEHQEYQIILKELSLNIEKVFNEINENQKLFQFKNINENDVSPSDINKNTLLYLKKKNETMLTYIIYITYYVFLKVMNCYTHNHPVLDKLIYINTIISKTNELDNKIKFKIQQLNKLPKRQLQELDISSSDDETQTTNRKKHSTGGKKIGKKSVDNEDEEDEEYEDEEEEIEEDEEEEEEEDEEDEDEEDEDEEDEDEDDEDEDEDEDEEDEEEEEEEEEEIEGDRNNKNKKYKVSKSIITEYTDSHIREKMKEEKKKQREKMKNERSIFLKEIKDMVSNKPEKIEEENYLKKLEEKFTDFDDKILKKKMKMLSKKKNRMNNLSNVGMTSNDLLKFVELPEMNNENDNTSFHENKIFRNNINKIKQKNKNKLMNNNANDDFVSFKKFNKIQNKNNSYDNKEQNPLNKYSFGKNMHDEIDDENIKNMLKFKKNRKEQRKTIMDKKNKEIRKQLVDQENEIDDRRMPNKNIIQNKGLVRKRKSTDGNARVHNKLKYMKKMKTYNSQHPKFKTHDNNYDGVKKGINPYLKKSIDIK
ncbi:conserved Plasmodium protein, unknown function [Plasmodium ovale curtisi]|uniref:Sas10 C-terminal domain-containing protein n=1 Tax=Plasmodium ovale curtisi TaxID=864141 RepID=A0A1A8WTW8_PLAOA|nr:conserved Plasmodium protein, unknown function [Plasmodium ovale curtisi]